MYLYFKRSNGELQLVDDNVESDEVVFPIIDKDIKRRNPNFKVYYIRTIHHEDCISYDVGSHTEFYYLSDRPMNV